MSLMSNGQEESQNRDKPTETGDHTGQRPDDVSRGRGKTGRNDELEPDTATPPSFEIAKLTQSLGDGTFAAAPSAAVAQRIIDVARANNIEYARDWEFKLANFCALADKPSAETPAPDLFNQKPWLLERARKFCEGYAIPDTADMNSLENLMNLKEREYEREFLGKLSSVDVDKQSEFITSTIVTSKFPEQISAIANLLSDFRMSTGSSPWDPLGDNHLEAGYSEAQQFALTYFTCMRFRSCEQNSIQFAELCFYVEACTEAWTFEDILVNSATPIQWEMAMRIVAILFAQYAKHGY